MKKRLILDGVVLVNFFNVMEIVSIMAFIPSFILLSSDCEIVVELHMRYMISLNITAC